MKIIQKSYQGSIFTSLMRPAVTSGYFCSLNRLNIKHDTII